MAARRFLALEVLRTRHGFTFPAGSLIDCAQLATDEVDSLIARRLIVLAPEQYCAGTVEAFGGVAAPACAQGKVS